MIYKPFRATLFDTILEDGNFLPLTERDKARLLTVIPEGESMFLTIKDNLYEEWVKATNQCGFVLIERGIGGSTPRKFVKGSCVFFEMSLPAIDWRICNLNCCADEECPCVPVTADGYTAPPATVGTPWRGTVVFTGDLPMTFGVTGMPSWMTASAGASSVVLSGTPTAVGTSTIAVTGINCSGQNNAMQQFTVTTTATATASQIFSVPPVPAMATAVYGGVSADPFQPAMADAAEDTEIAVETQPEVKKKSTAKKKKA